VADSAHDPEALAGAERIVEEALFYDDPQGRGRVFQWLDQWTRKDSDPYLPLTAEAVTKALSKAGLLSQDNPPSITAEDIQTAEREWEDLPLAAAFEKYRLGRAEYLADWLNQRTGG
jgi:hypothetical protein